MQKPPYLKKGDTIALVSTARKVNTKELEDAMELLDQWGLKVVLGKTIGASHHQFAGDDNLRANDFQHFLDDPKCKAIWCVRGGYGTIRIIDKINFSTFISHPTWIIGYSDVTVLHSHIHVLGIETIHAQMPVEIATKTETTKTSIKQVLFGEIYSIHIASNPHNKQGSASGQLTGGNLSILYSLCGSPSAINTSRKILFIEDLDEYLYHIDRMLQNLKRNGLFNNLSALIVGGMTQLHDNTIPFGKTVEDIVLELCKEYDFPIVFNFPAGHVSDNRALVLGRQVTLNVSKKEVSLLFTE